MSWMLFGMFAVLLLALIWLAIRSYREGRANGFLGGNAAVHALALPVGFVVYKVASFALGWKEWGELVSALKWAPVLALLLFTPYLIGVQVRRGQKNSALSN